MAFDKRHFDLIDLCLGRIIGKYSEDLAVDGEEFQRLTLEYFIPAREDYNIGMEVEGVGVYIPTKNVGQEQLHTPQDLVRLPSGLLIHKNATNVSEARDYIPSPNARFWQSYA